MKRRFLAFACVLGAAGWVASTGFSAGTAGATCPSQGMVTSSSPISVSGGMASVSFTVAEGCKDVQLSLVSYQAPGPAYSEETSSQQVRYQSATTPFSAGSWTMSVAVPNCYFQVDFVYGESIEHLSGDTSGSYSKQGRLISFVNGGTNACTTTQTTAPVQTPVRTTAPAAPAPPASISVVKLERVGPTGDFVTGPVQAKVGDTISYQIVVTNTGPAVTLSLADPNCSGLTPTGALGLESGKSISFTCSHTVVAADGSSWVNTATATATAANGIPVTASSTVAASLTVTGVLGTTKTIKHTAKTKHVKVKKVTKRAKPARAHVRAASFTG